MIDREGDGAVVVVVATLLAAGLVAAGPLAGTAAAGDAPEVIEFEDDEIEAEPGEEIEVDVLLRADGRTTTDAVERIEFRLDYQPDHLEVVELQPGPFLELGEETTVESEAFHDDEQGVAELHMWRDPVAGGAEGDGQLATVVLEVDEDAPTSTIVVDTENTEIELTEEWPPFVFSGDLEVHVDGGGDVLEPDLEDDAPDEDDRETLEDDSDGTDDETTADGDDGSADEDGTDDEPADDDSDALAPALVTVLALAAVLLIAAYRAA